MLCRLLRLYHLISYFEIWDAVGLDDITDYSKPVPIMGMPVGYDTVSFEDIKKIIEKYHIAEKLPKNISSYLLDYDPSEETPKHPTCAADYYKSTLSPIHAASP